MWPLRSIIAGLAGALTAATVFAGDIPAPVKKPRDKTGAVVTKAQAPAPEPAKSKSLPQPAEPPPKPRAGEKATPQPAKQDAGTKPGKAAAQSATQATAPAAPVPVQDWSQEAIALAKAQCNAVLANIDAVTVPELAFRDGECGAPAAVRVISIGKNPQVSLSPPAVLTCDMVVGLHTWMKQHVQPLAKKYLGSEIIKIETMSGYACRNAYGRTGGKLSEHGHANALDIRGFVTAKAQTAYVLEQWGPVQRDIIAAKIAAEKAAADKAAAAAAAVANSGPAKTLTAAPSSAATTAGNPSATLKKTISDVPSAAIGTKPPPGGTSMGFEPARLGGPKDKEKNKDKNKPAAAQQKGAKEAVAPIMQNPLPAAQRTSIFLHDVHRAACKIFGTTLGPEANDAHRNHFHVDMAPRKTTKICD